MKSAERLKILGLKGISAIVTAAMIAALAAEPISGGISAKAANTDEPLKISEWGSLNRRNRLCNRNSHWAGSNVCQNRCRGSVPL